MHIQHNIKESKRDLEFPVGEHEDYYSFGKILAFRGPDSSAGIATDYGLDGPGIESRWGEIIRLSRPVLGSIQPRVQRVPGLARG